MRIETTRNIEFLHELPINRIQTGKKDCYLVDGPVNLGRLITLPDSVVNQT